MKGNPVETISVTQQKAFLTVLLYIATIDNEYHPAEQDFVQRAINASALGEAERLEVLKTLEIRPPLDATLALIDDPLVAKQLVQQLVLLAHSDDEYVPAERDGVRRVAQYYKMSEDWVEALEQWAKEGVEWRRRGELLLSG